MSTRAQLRAADPARLAAAVREGDRRALARLLSLVEDGQPEQLRVVAETLVAEAGKAILLGLTGAPGVGKSTICDALISSFRKLGKTVAVLAVDPSSPFTGGALLGDRVRMQRHAVDDGVFIRSMASRGHLGGLAWATPQAVRVLDAAGFDVVIVETVGVGQAEVEIAGLADTTVVALAPGLGDAIQVAKAGILEIADVFVVNKADRDGAKQLARDLRQMLHLGAATPWQIPVVTTSADRGQGIDELVAAIDRHQRHLGEGEGARRRQARAAREIEALALATFRRDLAAAAAGLLEHLAEQVAAGSLGPHSAADKLVDELRALG
jgi:LAO/AO transport system kinase